MNDGIISQRTKKTNWAAARMRRQLYRRGMQQAEAARVERNAVLNGMLRNALHGVVSANEIRTHLLGDK